MSAPPLLLVPLVLEQLPGRRLTHPGVGQAPSQERAWGG
jgi:hypothetical protein